MIRIQNHRAEKFDNEEPYLGLPGTLAHFRRKTYDLQLEGMKAFATDTFYRGKGANQVGAYDASSFFSLSTELMCVLSFDGGVTKVNPAWEAELGWAPADHKARSFLDLVHPEDRQKFATVLKRLISGGAQTTFEARCLEKQGEYRWLQWTLNARVKDQRIYIVARDNTQLKKLEDSLRAADHEMRRLQGDLHDGLCQALSGIAAMSAVLEKQLKRQEGCVGGDLAAEMTRMLNETNAEARSLANGFSPVGLRECCLTKALVDLAYNIGLQFHISCETDIVNEFPRLAPLTEVQLYRIAQEAVHNAVVHGLSKQIKINLFTKDGFGFLNIQDNGKGFKENSCHKSGMGLQSMAYRADVIKGVLKVIPHNTTGMAVTCTFPLADAFHEARHTCKYQ
jgi:PAS domain S-box-containing protein